MSDVGKAWRAAPLAGGQPLPGGRPLPVPGIAALLWLLLAAAAVLWGLSSDMPAEILSYQEDIVFLGLQHIELVAWAGGLAILTGVPAVLTDFVVGRLQVHLVPRGINPLR